MQHMESDEVAQIQRLIELVDGLQSDVQTAAGAGAELLLPGETPVGVGVSLLNRSTSDRENCERSAQEAIRMQVLREAEFRHVQSALPLAHVSVLFDERVDLDPARVDSLAGDLMGLCVDHRDRLFEGVRLTASDERLPVGIDAVRVRQAHPIRMTCWTGTTSQWIDSLEVDHVQHAIDAGFVAADAAEGHDERWVVLTTDPENLSEVPQHVLEHVYETPAQRAFVFVPGVAEPRELATAYGGSTYRP